jgi:hypothetical protein
MTKTSSPPPFPGRVNARFIPSGDQAGAESGLAFRLRFALPVPSGAIENTSSFFSAGSNRQAPSLTNAILPFAAWEPAVADPPPRPASAPARTSTASSRARAE